MFVGGAGVPEVRRGRPRPATARDRDRGSHMVALRRPDELPPPPEDQFPTRPIKAHSLDKLHYWGCYLEAASTALKAKFRTRVCADIFAGYGVCTDIDGTRHWGSALLALQVAAPFDVYFFNDLSRTRGRCSRAARAR